jgi:DNA-binding MarR family transcriptional regulator
MPRRREAQKLTKVPQFKKEPVIELPCLCASVRRAARVITQFYDDAVGPTGLRITQFTLLQTLSLAPGISQKRLARILEIDSTTLTRTLAHLRRKGWLRVEAGTDRRELRLSLTAAGLEEYKRVVPYWKAAQRRLRKQLGETNWNMIGSAAMRIAEITPSREE